MNEGFGSPAYTKDALRAEISPMMTGKRVGVSYDPSRGAAYVGGWAAALKEDPQEIRRAAADAQKISDFVLPRSRERQAEREPTPVAATHAPAPPARRPARTPAAGTDPGASARAGGPAGWSSSS